MRAAREYITFVPNVHLEELACKYCTLRAGRLLLQVCAMCQAANSSESRVLQTCVATQRGRRSLTEHTPPSRAFGNGAFKSIVPDLIDILLQVYLFGEKIFSQLTVLAYLLDHSFCSTGCLFHFHLKQSLSIKEPGVLPLYSIPLLPARCSPVFLH
jgi:hypothetical protein